jgi:hypothetical protein
MSVSFGLVASRHSFVERCEIGLNQPFPFRTNSYCYPRQNCIKQVRSRISLFAAINVEKLPQNPTRRPRLGRSKASGSPIELG